MIARLFLLAHGRSGDKGDLANIGVIARQDSWYEFLCRELTAERGLAVRSRMPTAKLCSWATPRS